MAASSSCPACQSLCVELSLCTEALQFQLISISNSIAAV
uniref:Uncharacterized protein n=1 Tax=Anguilla anguilla TaxID=7936 RepID=A0A0E9QD92_ANGAN